MASGLAAELKDKCGAEVTLVAGSGGVFDITVDGREIFSKRHQGRFPKKGEIESIIRQAASDKR